MERLPLAARPDVLKVPDGIMIPSQPSPPYSTLLRDADFTVVDARLGARRPDRLRGTAYDRATKGGASTPWFVISTAARPPGGPKRRACPPASPTVVEHLAR
jgi:hypothetical protein